LSKADYKSPFAAARNIPSIRSLMLLAPLSNLGVFVDGLGQDKEDEAIAHAVLALARALDLQTVPRVWKPLPRLTG